MSLKRLANILLVVILPGFNLNCGIAEFRAVEMEELDLNRLDKGNNSKLPMDSQDSDVVGDPADQDRPADGKSPDDATEPPPPPPPPPNACEAYLELSCRHPEDAQIILRPQESYQDLDLSGTELGGLALFQTFWHRVVLERVCAPQVNLTQTAWLQVDGSFANWSDAIFFNSDLSNSSFIFAHLRQASFERSRLADMSFGESCLIDARFRETEFRGSSDFTAVIAPGIDFFRSFFSGTASFEEADLEGASFEQVIFDRPVSFKKANLRRVNFFKAEIARELDFSEADLSHAIWVDGSRCAEGSIGDCRF